MNTEDLFSLILVSYPGVKIEIAMEEMKPTIRFNNCIYSGETLEEAVLLIKDSFAYLFLKRIDTENKNS